MSNTAIRPARHWLDLFLTGSLFGYVLMGRSFAHVGIAPLYIGEVLMGSWLLLRPVSTLGPVFAGLLRPTRFSFLVWSLGLSLVYGILQTMRGLAYGHLTSVTIQNLVFHVYPIFLFVGLEFGRRAPNFLERMTLPLAWCNGLYGALYVLVFSRLGLTDDVTREGMGVLGQPNWTAFIILALVSFHGHRSGIWIPMLLNGFVLLLVQSRAEWLSFGMALTVWATLSGRMFRLLQPAIVLAMLLAIGWLADVKLPSPASRGAGDVSVRTLVGQVTAVFDHDVNTHRRDDSARAGTITWRKMWWKEMWKMVHATPARAFFGPGYGYPIWDLHPEGLGGVALRTPHNVMMYTLGYTGWVGFFLFLLCQALLGLLFWQSYRESGQALGFAVWFLGVTRSLFDNYFESPNLAIVYFLALGLLLAHQDFHRTRHSSIPQGAAS